MRHLQALGLVAAFVGLLAFATPSQAFDCEQPIVDGANRFGGNTETIETRIRGLQDLGAETRVLTVQDFGNGTLDQYVKRLQESCPSWQDLQGGVKNNLVIVTVEMAHREVGIYYGDLWRPALAGSFVEIKSRMIPRMRDGDFSGAFSNALADITETIQVDQQPAPPTVQGPTTIIQQEPVDLSGFFRVLGWLVGLAVLAGAIFGAISVFKSRQAAKAQKLAAKRDAQMAKATCVNLINAFDEPYMLLGAAISKAAQAVSAEDVAELRENYQSLQSDWNALSANFGRLDEVSGNDPSEDLTVLDYQSITTTYNELHGKLGPLSAKLAQLRADADEVSKSGDTAAEAISNAEQAIATATKDIETASGKGFKTKLVAKTVSEALAFLEEATKAATERRFASALASAKQASERAQTAAKDAQALEALKAQLDQDVREGRARIEEAQRLLEQARSVFTAISEEYAEVSWRPVAGNGSEAERRIQMAMDSFANAEKACDMKMQNWNDAGNHIQEATDSLYATDSLLQAILNLSASLAEAKRKATPEIEAAQADIERASAYLDTYRQDVDPSLAKNLGDAQSALAEAETALGQTPPDYLFVVRQALKANSAADQILELAMSQHETLERKRGQAKSFAEEAVRSIETADAYIRNHGSDVDSTARSRLGRAQALYESLRSARTLDQQIEQARAADAEADAALAEARRDVDDAEDARDRARRAQEASAHASREASRQSSTNWSTGRSSPGGFGGGSSSFGGGGSLGGGSSKW